MNKLLAAASLSLCASLAFAHVSLDPPRAEAGTTYRGVLRIGHGCEAAPTTAIEMLVPAGVTRVRAPASSRWQTLQTGNKVVWTAEAGKALGPQEKGELPVELQVPGQPGPLWIGVVQKCGSEAVQWIELPKQGTSTEGLKRPAVLLQVVTAQEAAAFAAQPTIENGWVRASVPGQQATGAFMRIVAKEPTQLVSVSTPVAGSAEVHEMKMEGDVMRMRAAGAIELPVGKPFELKPGGYHLMLQDLRKPLDNGSTVPLTLVFRNAKGVETRMELRLPVAVQPPAGGGAMPDHKH